MSWVSCVSAPSHPRPAQTNRAGSWLTEGRPDESLAVSTAAGPSDKHKYGSCRGAKETWRNGGEQKHRHANHVGLGIESQNSWSWMGPSKFI